MKRQKKVPMTDRTRKMQWVNEIKKGDRKEKYAHIFMIYFTLKNFRKS